MKDITIIVFQKDEIKKTLKSLEEKIDNYKKRPIHSSFEDELYKAQVDDYKEVKAELKQANKYGVCGVIRHFMGKEVIVSNDMVQALIKLNK